MHGGRIMRSKMQSKKDTSAMGAALDEDGE